MTLDEELAAMLAEALADPRWGERKPHRCGPTIALPFPCRAASGHASYIVERVITLRQLRMMLAAHPEHVGGDGGDA